MKDPLFYLGRIICVLFFLVCNHILSGQEILRHPVRLLGGSELRVESDSDHNLYVFGQIDDFDGEYQGRLIKLNSEGELVEDFNKLFMDAQIDHMVVLPDGKLIVGGDFSMLNGVAVSRIIRLNSDGTLDNTFNCALDVSIYGMKSRSNGNLIVHTPDYLVQILPDGAVDLSFGTVECALGYRVFEIAPDDAIFYYAEDGKLGRIAVDGTVNKDFAPEFLGQSSRMTIADDGKIYLGDYHITRLNADGSIDSTFADDFICDGCSVGGLPPPDEIRWIDHIEVQENGSITISRRAHTYSSPSELITLSNTGESLHSKEIEGIVTSLLPGKAGSVIVGGNLQRMEGVSFTSGIVRFDDEMNLETDFSPPVTYNRADNLKVSNGYNSSILLSSHDATYGYELSGVSIPTDLIAISENGELITNYNTTGGLLDNFSMVDSQGRLVIVDDDRFLRRYNVDGTIDASFSTPIDIWVLNDLKFVGEKMLLSGYFYDDDVPLGSVVMLNGDGSVNGNFGNQFANVTGSVGAQSTGEVLFSWGGSYLYRLNADLTLDLGFTINSAGSNFVVATDDRIYAEYEGTKHSFGRFLPSGQPDPSFEEMIFGNETMVMTAIPDGRIALTVCGEDRSEVILMGDSLQTIPLPRGSYIKSSCYLNGRLYITGRFFNDSYSDVTTLLVIALYNASTSPSTPTQLQATLLPEDPTTGQARVSLAWTDASFNESGFIIERAEGSPDNYELIAEVASNHTEYIDYRTILNGVEYFYRIYAYNDAGHSGFSNADSIIWIVAPESPNTLIAQYVETGNAKLMWSTSVNATSVTVERSIHDANSFQEIALLDGDGHQYLDEDVLENIDYFYRVKASNEAGSVYSDTAFFRFVLPPPAPSNLQVILSGSGVTTILWIDNSSDESNFVVRRSIDHHGEYQSVDTVDANVTNTSDVIEPFLTYYYAVQAVNDLQSASSDTIAFTWTPIPTGELKLNLDFNGESQYVLTWNATIEFHDAFIVLRSEDNAGNLTPIDTVAGNIFTYIDPVAEPIRYYYRVIAINDFGELLSNVAAGVVTASEISQDEKHHIYPVPVTNIFTLDVRGEYIHDITITNGRGQSISVEPVNNGALVFDASDLSPGIYVVQYSHNGNKRALKFVKQ